jgi:hypothetical protein
VLDEEQQIIGQFTGLSPAAKCPLQLQYVGVRLMAEIIDQEA